MIRGLGWGHRFSDVGMKDRDREEDEFQPHCTTVGSLILLGGWKGKLTQVCR